MMLVTKSSLPKFIGASAPRREKMAAPITWTIEPFEAGESRIHRMLNAICLWRGSSHAEILPVSFMAPLDEDWPRELFPIMRENLINFMNLELLSELRKNHVEGIRYPRVLIESKTSPARAARAIVELGLQEKAQIIAVSAHGRAGFNPHHLGSFAEALMRTSSIPVIVTSERTRIPRRMGKILFATDLKWPSQKAFSFIEKNAARLDVEVLVYDLPTFHTPHLVDRKTSNKANWKMVNGASVLAAADNSDVDLIVVTESCSIDEQSTVRREIRDILLGAHCPVLLVVNEPLSGDK